MELDPGIYRGIDFSEYLKIDAINASFINAFIDCPAKALVTKQDTAAMKFGREYHRSILEPEKECEKFTPAAEKKLKGMIDSFEMPFNSIAKSVIDNAIEKELTIIWVDPDNDVFCKGRIDILLPGNEIADLKTSKSARKRIFGYPVSNYGYDVQAAFYADGISALKMCSHNFKWVAHEKEPPYIASVLNASIATIEYGREKYKNALQEIKKCKETGIYNGYYTNEEEI